MFENRFYWNRPKVCQEIGKISCEHVLVFPWDQRGLLILGIPNLLVGGVYHVKNEGCLLEVFIMRLLNRTLSIYQIQPFFISASSHFLGSLTFEPSLLGLYRTEELRLPSNS